MNEAQQQTSYRDLQIDEIKPLIESGEYEVVDVREGWERERGHIPGSRHVVLNRILANPGGQKFADHTSFVCEVGDRSSVASEMVVALGVKGLTPYIRSIGLFNAKAKNLVAKLREMKVL